MPMTRQLHQVGYTYTELQKLYDAAPDKEQKKKYWHQMKQFLENAHENAPEFDTSDHVDSSWMLALEQIGFNNPTALWTISWSQGDGACFTCDWIDMRTLLRFMYLDSFTAQNVVTSGDKSQPHTVDRNGDDWRNFLAYHWQARENKEDTSLKRNFDLPEVWLETYGRGNSETELLMTLGERLSIKFEHGGRYNHRHNCRMEWEEEGVDEDFPPYTEDDDAVLECIRKDVQNLFDCLCDALYADLQQAVEYHSSDEYALEYAADDGTLLWVTVGESDPADMKERMPPEGYQFKEGPPDLEPCIGGQD